MALQLCIAQLNFVVGDLEGNGRKDVVVGTGDGPSGDAVATNSLTLTSTGTIPVPEPSALVLFAMWLYFALKILLLI